MRTIPYKEDLSTEFKSDLKRYPDNDSFIIICRLCKGDDIDGYKKRSS